MWECCPGELEPLLSSDIYLNIARVIQNSWDLEHTGMWDLGNKVLAVFMRIPLTALSMREVSQGFFPSLFLILFSERN